MTGRNLISAVLAVATLLAAAATADAFNMAISPMRFEFPLDARPVTRSLKVINQGSEPIGIRVKVGHWDLDEQNRLREIAPTEQSLDQWIIVRPLKLTTPPGKSRTLRFAVRPFTRPKPGEHRAMIFLEQTGAYQKNAQGIAMRFRFGVAVYAHVGQTIRKGDVKAVVAEGRGFGVDIKSVGTANVRMNGKFGIWPANKFPGEESARQALAAVSGKEKKIARPRGAAIAGLLPSTPVLPGYRRQINVPLAEELKPGKYRLVLAGKLGTSKLARSHLFQVPQ